MIAFVECLTLRTWGRVMLPYLMRRRGRSAARCYVLDASRPGLGLARATGRLLGVPIERLPVDILEVRDEQGRSVWLRILYQDLLEVQTEVMREPAFREFVARTTPGRPRLPMYLAKALGAAITRSSERQTLWRALLVIHLCVWKLRTESAEAGEAICFLERRPWGPVIARHAAAHGITLLPLPPARGLRGWLRDRVSPDLAQGLRDLRSWWRERRRCRRDRQSPHAAPPGIRPAQVRLAVEYYGHLNLAHPERYSNLFFWQQSSLPAQRVLVTFNLPPDPLDEGKWAEITTHGMSAIALAPEATTLPWASACVPPRRPGAGRGETPGPRGSPTPEGRWLARHLHAYLQERAFWTGFFSSQRIKVYVSWFKISERSCAIADALQEVGGVSVIYQRSFETHPSVQMSVAADIVFGCSAMTADVERQSHSVIPYFVVTGYLGDHRAALWRADARAIRQQLHRRGVTRSLAFCDENSSDRNRWAPGHALMREAYAFLLERVLQEPWFGLLIKPKTPLTLRRRLGPVAALLTQAEATGRCMVFEEGRIQGAVPPAAAALAADVLVHGHLWGATAGVESALTGVPTLLMDREGWPVSPFYRLGVGRVVFTEWPDLWRACVEHWNRPGGIPGFGDWSAMVQDLDPFRDGRAAERMGTYLRWLLEGFDAGRDRDTTMAAAAERYARQWGEDKIIRIQATEPRSVGAPHAADRDLAAAALAS